MKRNFGIFNANEQYEHAENQANRVAEFIPFRIDCYVSVIKKPKKNYKNKCKESN